MSNGINLWIFYVAGYAIAFPLQIWANRKRGEPFEDSELLSQKKIIVPAMIWLIGGFIISLFVPVNFGFSFYLGFFFAIIGLIIVGFTFYSFAHKSGLTTTKIHRYSRNPNYVGWIFFIGGLSLIGWSESVWSIIFLLYFIFTVGYLHWTVLLEEAFLANKYGDSYQEYLKKTPRYVGIPKKSQE